MARISDTIDVNVPVSTAYMHWVHYEDFPKFMKGVEEVRRLDEKRVHWRAKVAGKKEEWDAEITEDLPDRRIAWRSLSGTKNDGMVEFEAISDGSTRVHVTMDYEPKGLIEKAGDLVGMDKQRLHGDLKHFKEFVEEGKTLH